MYVIAIEGIDGSGKQTLTSKIAQIATASGLTVATQDFPRYTTTFVAEQIVPKILRPAKDEPLTEEISIRNAKLFSDDRIDWQHNVVDKGDYDGIDLLILDRFSSSNVAYQSALMDQCPVYGDIASIVRNYERSSGVLEPDTTVLLPVDPSLALSRRRQRQTAEEDDLYESKNDLQNKVWQAYNTMCSHYSSWMLTDDPDLILKRAFQEV